MMQVDILIVGGGFYGSYLSTLFSKNHKVLLVEKEQELMSRASRVNQARIHNGYHYPRSLITAYRSNKNFKKFVREFNGAVVSDFTKLYAIAKKNSKVNANRFYKMFSEMGAPIAIADQKYQRLFNGRYIEQVFSVQEYAFDYKKLREIVEARINDHQNVSKILNTTINDIKYSKGLYVVTTSDSSVIEAKKVINCTYSSLNQFVDSSTDLIPLKHELTEMALVKVPDILAKVGVTVMDGAYFSLMPFPSENLHSLSHVRYTPHFSWTDNSPLQSQKDWKSLIKTITSNYLYMKKDSERFLPELKNIEYVKSIYETKTVLLKNEIDDGRPILLRYLNKKNTFAHVLGGKIDNIYDINEQLKKDFFIE